MGRQHVPSSSNKAIDEEVARRVQQLLAIQKEQADTRGEEIILNRGGKEASADLSNMDAINYKTPEVTSSLPPIETYFGKTQQKVKGTSPSASDQY